MLILYFCRFEWAFSCLGIWLYENDLNLKLETDLGFFVSGKRVKRVELGCHWANGYLWKFANQKFNKFFDSILCFCYAALFQLEFRLSVSLMSFVFICISYYTILHHFTYVVGSHAVPEMGFVWICLTNCRLATTNNAQNCSAEQFNIIKSDCCPENICGH